MAGSILLLLAIISLSATNKLIDNISVALSLVIAATTLISLLVSYYVYDFSELYRMRWLSRLQVAPHAIIVNIHAGFDETSECIKALYPFAQLMILDFYDKKRHTELSIERARKYSTAVAGTIQIQTERIPVDTTCADIVLNIFSLHEIRDREERIKFLKEQVRVMKKDGTCVIVEHLRDLPNFAAYNIGFLHFLSLKEWLTCFSCSGLRLKEQFKITPFISVFILTKF